MTNHQSSWLCRQSLLFSLSLVVLCCCLFSTHVPETPWKEVLILTGWFWAADVQSWSANKLHPAAAGVETTQTIFLKPVLSFFKTFLLVKLWHAASVGAEDGATATLLCLWTRVELNLEEGERQRCHPSVKRLANKSRQSRGRREGKERTRGEIWRAKG